MHLYVHQCLVFLVSSSCSCLLLKATHALSSQIAPCMIYTALQYVSISL